MTEILFYHLERQSLQQVLPTLLERSVERGWRAVVQGSDPERLNALDTHLWTYEPDSFLAHGLADEFASDHPVLLTLDDSKANGAQVRFLIDGAPLPANAGDYTRLVILFDGNDPEAVAGARAQWKEAKATGHACQYWQQDENGKWGKKG